MFPYDFQSESDEFMRHLANERDGGTLDHYHTFGIPFLPNEDPGPFWNAE